MQITITGPRGGGANTLAAELLKHLKGLGQEVRIVCGSNREAAMIQRMAKRITNEMTQSARITIVLTQEPEDEAALPLRDSAAHW